MATQREQRIVDGELMSEPHLKGRRIAVMMIVDKIEKQGLDPAVVADKFDLDMTDVYSALLYYYENPGAFVELRDEKRAVQEDEDLSKYPMSVDES